MTNSYNLSFVSSEVVVFPLVDQILPLIPQVEHILT
jgi:hypothetical protein